MFIHETHMPQLLKAEQYTAPEQLELELQKLFLPSWQLVGTLADAPNDGDFFTLELFGYPLIVWNSGGQMHTFLNVCPHRFSRIKREPCGNAAERLKCQYHGWEYDCDGNTRLIPDARSFKPMTQGALSLTKYRTERCGQLIFVNLSGDAACLPDALGPVFDAGREWFAEDRKLFHMLDMPVAANWKAKVENALESYHVGLIHPTTFGQMPEAEICEHELDPRWTSFSTINENENKIDRLLDRIVHRAAKLDLDPEYKHYLLYPNLMLIKMRLFTWAEAVAPVSATEMSIRTYFFCHTGRATGLRERLLRRGLTSWGKKFFTKVAHEDAGIVPEVQRGFDAPVRPSKGLISIREERCFHFQEYIQRETGRAAEAQPASKREYADAVASGDN